MTTEVQPTFDPKEFLVHVGNGRSIGKYATGATVFSQGEPADSVFFIQRGKVKITVVSEQGKEAVVAMLGRNEFFGEGCLAGQAKRISTVDAVSDSVISRLDKAAILRVIHEQPAFSEMFIAHLLGRAVRAEADLVDQLFDSSEKRLARLLLLLANFGKEGKPEPIIAKISQETLAQMIGTKRARVSFFMNKFRKLGFISYNGRIEVHSSLLNAVLHDQPHIEPGADRLAKVINSAQPAHSHRRSFTGAESLPFSGNARLRPPGHSFPAPALARCLGGPLREQ